MYIHNGRNQFRDAVGRLKVRRTAREGHLREKNILLCELYVMKDLPQKKSICVRKEVLIT